MKAIQSVLRHYNTPGKRLDLYEHLPDELSDHEALLRQMSGLDCLKTIVGNRHILSLF